ncbi:MAG: Asp-tRNA(Asn)/Glu-tRNA(Gln) amidotransferase subunit GatB [Patescibacteria group bacterium]
MSKYVPTIGLEIHAELKTKTKMFCDSLNDPDEKRPNVNVCPVCLGHPGTLPVINKQAVEATIKVGLALGGKIAAVTKFDRKNYFYPDLPKGYQISQFDEPIVAGGTMALRKAGTTIKVTRVHLEEDAGRLQHSETGTLVDYNRAGLPLMELVTDPDFKTSDEAVEFAKNLQLILRYLGASDADMDRGQMRVEANVSLGKWFKGNWKWGTKVEVKNINSFRAVHDAIEYELKRQEGVLKRGEKVKQETRGWDDVKKITVSQRSKEEAHDYRYFPEPDLPPFETKSFDLWHLKNKMPELPAAKFVRLGKEYALSEEQAALLVEDKKLSDFFEAAASELAARDEKNTSRIDKKPRDLLFNYLTSDLLGLVNETGTPFSAVKVTPEHLAHLVDLIADGKIMSRQAKDILRKMFDDGSDPEEILENEGLHTVSDSSELETTVREIIADNPAAVADYKKGKEASVQFLIGKAMAKLKGRGSPEVLKELFLKHLTPTP